MRPCGAHGVAGVCMVRAAVAAVLVPHAAAPSVLLTSLRRFWRALGGSNAERDDSRRCQTPPRESTWQLVALPGHADDVGCRGWGCMLAGGVKESTPCWRRKNTCGSYDLGVAQPC
jgi:hypothetical protein